MRTLLLIDANSIIHRAFHALPPFTSPDGRPTGALYGIASILIKLWREERPDYVAALFDRPEPTFRDKKYAAYKAQRPPAADELIAQIIEAHNLFKVFGVRTFEEAGYEADDLIATFAERFKKEPDLQVIILTGDRDTLQLVDNDRVVVRTFNKGVSDTTTYDEGMVLEKYGLKPAQLVDYKALAGDPSDNIKGVPGAGPKTATELLQRFGSVKKFYERLGEDPKLEKRFGPYQKEAELAEELVMLERQVPIKLPELAELASEREPGAAKAYFEAMGSATLVRRFEGREAPGTKPKNKKLPSAKEGADGKKSVQGTIF